MLKIDGSDEANVRKAILHLMSDGKVWTNAQHKKGVRDLLPLTKWDKRVGERPHEEIWENRVNNALGSARPNSLYANGYVQKIRRAHHQITKLGLKFIQNL